METCKEAFKKQHDGEFKYYKSMAKYIKEQVDKKIGPSYHVIVGKLHLGTLMQSTNQTNLCLECRNQLWQLCNILSGWHVSILARTCRLPCLQTWMSNINVEIVCNSTQDISLKFTSQSTCQSTCLSL